MQINDAFRFSLFQALLALKHQKEFTLFVTIAHLSPPIASQLQLLLFNNETTRPMGGWLCPVLFLLQGQNPPNHMENPDDQPERNRSLTNFLNSWGRLPGVDHERYNDRHDEAAKS